MCIMKGVPPAARVASERLRRKKKMFLVLGPIFESGFAAAIPHTLSSWPSWALRARPIFYISLMFLWFLQDLYSIWCLGGKLQRSELITMQTSHVGWYCSVREFVCLVTALAPWFPSNPGLLYRYSRLSVTPLVDQELWRVARCVIDSVLPVPVPI